MLLCLQISLSCEDIWSVASLNLFKGKLLPQDWIGPYRNVVYQVQAPQHMDSPRDHRAWPENSSK